MNAPDPLAHQAIAGPRWRPAPLLRALGPAFGTLLAPTPLWMNYSEFAIL